MLDDDGGGGGGGEETLTLEEELRNIQNHIKLTRLVLSITIYISRLNFKNKI